MLGRLGRALLARGEDASIEGVMTAGPSTVRPSLDLLAAVERMRAQNLTSLPATTADGRLVGLLVREKAEEALRGSPPERHSAAPPLAGVFHHGLLT